MAALAFIVQMQNSSKGMQTRSLHMEEHCLI